MMSESVPNATVQIAQPLVEGQVVNGTLFNEPMRVETIRQSGSDAWVVGLCGLNTERFRRVTLTTADLAQLQIQKPHSSYQGDGHVLRIGVQAYSLGIAYEFDPYFGLFIARVDPLPHQLEAVYDYLLKLARVRFLLADDAGAGNACKTGPAARPRRSRRVYCPGCPELTGHPSARLAPQSGRHSLVGAGRTTALNRTSAFSLLQRTGARADVRRNPMRSS